MILLGIETSCDETSAALIEHDPKDDSITILANVVTSSLSFHAKTGGIIPEIAAREQLKYILPVISQALSEGIGFDMTANKKSPPIDAIAVTVGPGLIGSLLIGVETARTLSYLWKKPLIPVNHLLGHIYANWLIANSKSQYAAITFPALALVVSGGHTDLVLMNNHEDAKVIGGTRDDAAGEAFDKIGRLLGLPYPAGPIIAKLAKKGNPKSFPFPRPLIGSDDFDFSFSGLKTAVLREVKTIKQLASPSGGLNNETIANICASVQHAIVDVLVKKTIKAAKHYQVKSILLGGGVAANQKLREQLKLFAISHKLTAEIFVPQKFLCTDNAAMIAAAGCFKTTKKSWKEITPNPELYFSNPA